jgi:hypothetical protein
LVFAGSRLGGCHCVMNSMWGCRRGNETPAGDRKSFEQLVMPSGRYSNAHVELVGLRRVCSSRMMVMKKYGEAISQVRVVGNSSLKEPFLRVTR